MLRLDKLLADAGKGTRSQVKEYIRRGRVTVNDGVCKKPEQKVSEEDLVCLDGQAVGYVRFRYYMLHKPQGVITATDDSRDKTVLDLLTGINTAHISPVGRLDKDTEGLLLLTNDGELAHRLLSPKRHVDKCYLARTEKPLSEADLQALEAGVDIGDEKPTLPARACLNQDGALLLTIREGRYHQVKRMLQAVGNQVIYLKRLSFGSLKLPEDLEIGQFRALTKDEQERLQHDVAGYNAGEESLPF
ncbi:MAG: rRNA pseudouridine synthase [Lachnospiraceae bacterium]|nr:rRNA pseudouridine synthase [Lachnospiraceae bacterium]